MQLNGVPIERLSEGLAWLIRQQLLADQETLRSKIVPAVAHAVLAKALQGTNKVGAVHLGAFKLGWRVDEAPNGADVVNDVLYAGVIELGRRPGRPGPPLEPILEWVRRKLLKNNPGALTSGMKKKVRLTPERREALTKGLAIAIQRSIHKKGTKPRFILRDAIKVVPKVIASEVRRYLPTGGAARGTA